MENDTQLIKNWYLWILLFLLPPFGISVLWFKKEYKKITKVTLSIIFSAYFLVILFLLGNA